MTWSEERFIMCYSLRAFLASLFLTTPLLLLAEPSAFERQSGITKDDIRKLQTLVSKLQQQIDTIQQSQEGISSLYESQSNKLQQQVIQGTTNTKDIEEIKSQLEINTQDIEEIKSHLAEISESILKELDNLSSKQTKPSKAKTESITTESTFTKDKTKSKEIFSQAQNAFQLKDYKEASSRFEWLIEINYKKASSHFYLGEIAYDSKSYDTAIYHYKQSAIANEKAKYMPTLLLHSAQSFNAIKDTKNYNKFLDTLIENYPESNEAKSAKKLKAKK